MSRFHVALFTSLMTGVITMRIGFNSKEGHRKQGLGTAPPLKLFATTYNAGNRVWNQASDADDMLNTLVSGHEEADIVMLGFQEYKDIAADDSELSEHLRSDLLWRSSFDEKVAALKAISSRAPPNIVVQARENILQKFQTFHDRLTGEIQKLQHLAKANSTFMDTVGVNSPAHVLVESLLHSGAVGKVQEQIQDSMKTYESSKKGAPQKQFPDLSVRLNAVKGIVDGFNAEDYAGHFNEITNWQEALQKEMAGFDHHDKNNFTWQELTSDGRESYSQLLAGFQDAPDQAWNAVQGTKMKSGRSGTSRSVGASSYLEDLKEKLRVFLSGVEMTASRASDYIVKQKVDQWNTIANDLQKLEEDLQPTNARTAAGHVGQKVADEVKGQANRLQEFLAEWKTNVHTHVDSVGNLPLFTLTRDQLEVPMVSEVFKSGDRETSCWAASHYDSDLRVYGNPWSPWKVNKAETKTFSIDYNGPSGWGGVSGQCGKGVNVVRLRLEASTGHKVNLCLLNSHQSFKYNFQHRLDNIVDTFAALKGGTATNDWQSAPNNVRWNTENLGCDATVYGSDFNSRLMCHVPYDRETTHPITDRTDGAAVNSFENILHNFCDSDSCSLANSKQNLADEMMQFLNPSAKINCYEQDDKKNWELKRNVPNPLFDETFGDHKIREAAAPDFAPTYKMVSDYGKDNGKKYKGKTELMKCLKNDAVCMMNESGKHKHNPSFTDRILVRDSVAATITTEYYQRRTFSSFKCDERELRSKACSDHVPVVALMNIGLNR